MAATQRKKRILKVVIAVVFLLIAGVGFVAWYKLFREEPEEAFTDPMERFKYGSLAAEHSSGIPYWIFVVLPRMFPEHLPGPTGLRSLGLPWEEGKELPVGFTKRVIGFPRVANNCAVCHAATYRTKEDETPRFVPAGPNHTGNVQGMIRFLSDCAADARFNADEILAEIDQIYRLSRLDKILYRYLLIPRTKEALLKRRDQFAWMNRPGWPDWGPGRDDPMNLTKYFMTNLPVDDSTGIADFPSVWNLEIREGKALNWDGATPSPRSVLIDSALGLGARNDSRFLGRMKWLEDWLKALPPPQYPLAVNEALAAAGRPVFDKECASCHAPGPDSRMGTIIDIREIGTDRERLDTWTQQAAEVANQTVERMGIRRIGLQKTNGYVSVPLDGLWLRAPYLHNGSVPNMRELLEPVEKRTKVFYRAYDVLDAVKLGFVTQGPEAERVGFRLDTTQRGNGNQGHLYGLTLSEREKEALVEYLKTF